MAIRLRRRPRTVQLLVGPTRPAGAQLAAGNIVVTTMTRGELDRTLRDLDAKYGAPEDEMTKWRREAAEREAELARREPRNLTDAQIQRWQRHFEELLELERMRLASLVQDQQRFTHDVIVELIGDLEREFEEKIDGLRNEFMRQAAISAGHVVELLSKATPIRTRYDTEPPPAA